jgi:hypothetical protein
MSTRTATRGWPVAQRTPGTAIRSRFQANAAHIHRDRRRRAPGGAAVNSRRSSWDLGLPGMPNSGSPEADQRGDPGSHSRDPVSVPTCDLG